MTKLITPITSVEEAVAIVESYDGLVADFGMPLASDLTMGGKWVPFDLAIAAITDKVLKKDLLPAGISEDNGMKIYKIRKPE